MRKTRILFNGVSLSKAKITGVERFALGALRSISAHEDVEIYLLCSKRIAHSKSLPKNVIPVYVPFFGHLIFFLFAAILKKVLRCQHIISPHSFPILFAEKTDFFTIHDIAWFYYPNFFPWKRMLMLRLAHFWTVKTKATLHTVSINTANDVKRFYNRNSNIFHAYPGAEYNVDRGSEKINDKALELERYLVFVGTYQKRKNLIHLFNQIDDDYIDISLKIIGGPGWLSEEVLEAYNEMKNKNRVQFLGYLDEKNKNDIIEKSLAIILPSLYEGFGFPVLEGLSYSKVALVADNSSLSEITYDKNLVFSLDDPYDLNRAIDYVEQNPVACLKHIDIMKDTFTWSNFAAKYKQNLDKMRQLGQF
jgi:glycosyltransferase involved in cell wall biosynthesis